MTKNLTLSLTGRPKGSGLMVTVPLRASSNTVAEMVVLIGTPNLLQISSNVSKRKLHTKVEGHRAVDRHDQIDHRYIRLGQEASKVNGHKSNHLDIPNVVHLESLVPWISHPTADLR